MRRFTCFVNVDMKSNKEIHLCRQGQREIKHSLQQMSYFAYFTFASFHRELIICLSWLFAGQCAAEATLQQLPSRCISALQARSPSAV